MVDTIQPLDNERRLVRVSQAGSRRHSRISRGRGAGRGASVRSRRAAENLTKSTMCVSKFPAEGSEQGTRPERRGMTALTNHGCQNDHLVALQVDNR